MSYYIYHNIKNLDIQGFFEYNMIIIYKIRKDYIMTKTEQIDAKGVELIKKILDYFTSENILAFNYAEAIDDSKAALITVTIAQEKLENVPAKKIALLNATEKDKDIIKSVVKYMQEEQIEFFNYSLNIPNNPMSIEIKVYIQDLIPINN